MTAPESGTASTNRATWNALFWIVKQDTIYRETCRILWHPTERIDAANRVKMYCSLLWGDATPDGCPLADVDWGKIVTGLQADTQFANPDCKNRD